MKEILTLCVRKKYASSLLAANDGYDVDDDLKDIEVDTSSPIMKAIEIEAKEVWNKHHTFLVTSWHFKRKYSNKELQEAVALQLDIKKMLELDGVEFGTQYDENAACPICGANRKQLSMLKLGKGRYLYKRDVALTMGGDIIVSKRFKDFVKDNSLSGVELRQVYSQGKEEYYQLIIQPIVDLSCKTIFGSYIFNVCPDEGDEVYKCPRQDNLGLHLLSEVYLVNNNQLNQYDFFISRQTYGVKRGLFRPRHLLFCTPRVMQLMHENTIRGFNFEVAHIDED